MVTITLDLEPKAAAGLKRFAEKISHEQAQSVLYPHVKADIRSDQAYQIMASSLQHGVPRAGLGDAGSGRHRITHERMEYSLGQR